MPLAHNSWIGLADVVACPREAIGWLPRLSGFVGQDWVLYSAVGGAIGESPWPGR